MNDTTNPELAYCTDCKQHKPKVEFTRNRARKSGLHSICKLCTKARKSTPEYKAFVSTPEYIEKERQRNLRRYYSDREAAYSAYGGAFCAWCRATSDLQIDHINNNGANDQDIAPRMRCNVASTLRRRGFPLGYQILCGSCNRIKAILAQLERQISREDCPERLKEALRTLISLLDN